MPHSCRHALVIALAALAGCVPVIVAGAAGGAAMVATDRRSAGAQVDDEAIELKVGRTGQFANSAIASTST